MPSSPDPSMQNLASRPEPKKAYLGEVQAIATKTFIVYAHTAVEALEILRRGDRGEAMDITYDERWPSRRPRRIPEQDR